MKFGPLYHWSPRDRRESIRVDGLKPYCPPSVHSDEAADWAMGCGVICLGPTPSAAWGLSGGMDRFTSEELAWDLWQVNLADTDEIHVRAEFGPTIKEVRVHNAIPGDRVWWVGERA